MAKTRNRGKLKLYRRHLAACKHKDKGQRFDRCHCPIWIRGTWAGEKMRKSLDVDTWERAEEMKRVIEQGNAREQPQRLITIEHATQAFVKECEARDLHASTLGKYRRLKRRIDSFGQDRGLVECSEITPDLARAFRGSWAVSGRTAAKELERFKALMRFCVENGFMEKDPSKGLKAPQVKVAPACRSPKTTFRKFWRRRKTIGSLLSSLRLGTRG